MSLKINVEIVVLEGEQYTPLEQAVVSALAGGATISATPAAAPAPTVTEKPAVAAAPKAAPKAAPAKVEKPAPSPKSAQSTTPAVLDTTLDEEETVVEEAEEDLLGGGDATSYTKDEAIQKATKLLSAQKMAVVKAALAVVGAKKVSDLNDHDDIQKFMAAVAEAEA